MRSRSTFPLLLVLLLPGCAIGPGEPFGEVSGLLGGSIESRGRISDDGRLQTVGSYEVLLQRVEAEVSSVRLIESGSGGGTGFDPTSPPPGWLCHGDHCHTPDGDLVSYDEAALILAGGPSGPSTLLTFPVDAVFDLLGGEDQVPLTECSSDCRVGRSVVSLIAVDISHIIIEGEVADLLPESRLGFESLPLRVDLATDGLTIYSRFEDGLIFDRGHAPLVALDLSLLIHPSILDGIPFDESVDGEEIRIESGAGARDLPPAAYLVLDNLEASGVAAAVERLSP